MSRGNPENLRLPPAVYRVDKRTDDPNGVIKFETLPECIREDERRQRSLQHFIADKLGGRKARRAAEMLLKVLRDSLAEKPQRLSAASRVMMRDWRIRICGWLWSLIAPLGGDEWVYFTVALPNWWVHSRDLKNLSAKALKAKLRAALYRAGAGTASGWLYAMPHAEFDGATAGYPFHFHGIATHGMIKVLKELRKQPQFSPGKADSTNFPQVAIAKKLQIDKPRGCLPDGITYTSKSYIPQHNSRVEEDGKRRRFGKKHRIREVKHEVRTLLWLHSQLVKDQVLLVHLAVIDGALVPTKREDRKAK